MSGFGIASEKVPTMKTVGASENKKGQESATAGDDNLSLIHI